MYDMITIAVGNNQETDLMKAFLESQGISVFLKAEIANSVVPHHVAPGGMGAVQLQVPKDQEKRARELLQENS